MKTGRKFATLILVAVLVVLTGCAGMGVVRGGLALTDADRMIAKYCGDRYPGWADFSACRAGAYSGPNDYWRNYYGSNRGGLYAGRQERIQEAWEDGRKYGRSIGRAGY